MHAYLGACLISHALKISFFFTFIFLCFFYWKVWDGTAAK